MKSLFFTSLAAVALIAACTQTSKQDTMSFENPFYQEFTTPYATPSFDSIENADYLPAFKEAIKRHDAEIKTIVENTDAPTFDNTVLSFDCSGEMLTLVSNTFFNLLSADANPELQKIAKEVTPMISEHENNIMLNDALFKRIETVYLQRAEANLTAEQIRAVEEYYKDFIRNGAGLNQADKDRLREINARLSMLELEFGDNVLAETGKNFRLIVDNKDDLKGLPQTIVVGAAETAKNLDMEGKWVFQLSRASITPFLQYAENRDLREKIYKAYYTRANHDNEFDNKAIIKEMVTLRAEKAKLLGFETHADYVIDVNMAENSKKVDAFLSKLWNAALPVAKQEKTEMQTLLNSDGGNFELQSWDWAYYAEKLRKEKYNLDENELKPYLQLDNVRDGMFWVANRLYGIAFEKQNDISVYHPEVEVFRVSQSSNDSLIGFLYLDYYVRDSKQGGAWCTEFRNVSYNESGERIVPLISVVCNFPKPTETTPSLLSWDETTTLFHEFGHALHGLFTDGHYKRTAGVVPRDYVEFPSQVMENFAGEPEVLRHFAKHYETGETMPDDLIEKLNNSGHFNQGFATVEYLAAAILDMKWHELKSGESIDDVAAFEKSVMDELGLIDEIIPRYRSTYFQHIFNGGYSAGYYVYIWSEVLDADAFQYFKESGNIFNPDLALKFRKHCLTEVGNAPAMEQYIKFRGQEPSEIPLLQRRGLK